MVDCGKNCEVYSRIVGYFRPVQNWNLGKKQEFKDRLEYSEKKSMESAHGRIVQLEAIKAVA